MKKKIQKMKNLYLTLLGISFFTCNLVNAQILRAVTPRYNNPSVKGNIVYVANNIITSQGGNTSELPPAGTSTNNGKVGENIDIDGTPSVKYINFGSSWRYLANNTRPANWETVAYSDVAWPSGVAELGYGQGDEATCIPSGGGGTLCLPTGTKYITTYFRKVVNIPNPALHSEFSINLKRDDGAVVYLNGVEVVRSNLPAGAITHSTLAPNATDQGNTVFNYPISTSLFVAGNNTIAVELHQTSATSSDISFDFELEGKPIDKVSIFPLGSTWKYLANNTRPAGWETTSFVDGGWPSNVARFGYGSDGEVTCIPSGGGGTVCNPTGNKWTTTYFRKTVNIANPSLYANFEMNMMIDDGAVVYVNGIEVLRSNLPAGAITHATFANTAIGGVNETTLNKFLIPKTAFIAGNNTIAVEIHQVNLTSSDLGFDMELLGSLDSTFNSSSADLNLPSCSHVLFAGLYWGASQGSNGTNTSWINNENKIKLKLPGAANYIDLTSTQTDYHNNTLIPGLPHTGYRGFVDITSIVNSANANGTYTIANLCSPAGISNTSGGWTIVIAYADPATVVRNLTVFDGSAIMNGGDPPLHIPITGFLTPPTGPVSCELGAVVYDGDRVSQDEFSFKQNSNPAIGTYTNLTPNATANLNDMWNSSITYKGAVVNTRNPAHNNTLGFDAHILVVPNTANVVLGNSQNSASIRFSSPSENYIMQVATTAISQYTPSFAVTKSSFDINGGTLQPGDSIRYRIDYTNRGNDASTATTITDNIPVGSSYRLNSLSIGGVAKTDAPGDDEAEYDYINNRVIFRLGTGATSAAGGEVASTASGYVQFKVNTPTSCAILTCNNTISNKAFMSYNGKLSGLNLQDSSGVLVAGCITPQPVLNTITGLCSAVKDTILTNICPISIVTIPIDKFVGYRFYSSMPFVNANLYDPSLPVTFTRTIYAFYDGPGTCDDTKLIRIYILACPDIDDDNDGIPDYVEINNPLALQDHNSNGIPNWKDAAYPGYIDRNGDGFNDNFDPGADSDGDGIPNFYDKDFPGFVDANNDGVNDAMDKDLDGIPNNLDLDSDNDGIPDVVESYGVDENGDGRIDNYSDTDNDGLSQNVDASNTGVGGSGNALGAQDLDGDGIPNYLDTDSDNDGIPDIIEALGADVNNDGKVDTFIDTDGDGLSDIVDSDIGNDGIAENTALSLLRTGPDTNNDGRANSYPFTNFDFDGRANPYDLDADGDGITDVLEGGFTDANFNAMIDGAIGTNGWNAAVDARPNLGLFNTDGRGNPDFLDIDADDDGIPDNVEGQTTVGYRFPAYLDADNDGLDNAYDGIVGFGGTGIFLSDKDVDNIPDYRDFDTDSDGILDIVEGNDFNLNGRADDDVALTFLDTDGDGLDNKFDSLTSTTNLKGTSYRMGTGGSLIGDAAPGSRCTVQKTTVAQSDRDWRDAGYVLKVQYLSFNGIAQNNDVALLWSIFSSLAIDHFEIERSTDNSQFAKVISVNKEVKLNELNNFSTSDNIKNVNSALIFYRLKIIGSNGQIEYSNVIVIRKNLIKTVFSVQPNPATTNSNIHFNVEKEAEVTVRIIDPLGKIVMLQKTKATKGNNIISLNNLSKFSSAVYSLQIIMNNEVITQKLIIQNK